MNIRNPWGKFEWDGDWGDHSKKWTPELAKAFELTREDDGHLPPATEAPERRRNGPGFEPDQGTISTSQASLASSSGVGVAITRGAGARRTGDTGVGPVIGSRMTDRGLGVGVAARRCSGADGCAATRGAGGSGASRPRAATSRPAPSAAATKASRLP